MELITGGRYQGKLEYVLGISGLSEEDVADGAGCAVEEIYEKKIINDFNSIVKRLFEKNEDVYAVVETLFQKNKDAYIIVDELGCGLVPTTPSDREFRELVGRVSCEMAKKSKRVHRVVCGIGGIIKDA